MSEQEISPKRYQYILLVLLLVIGVVLYKQAIPYIGGILGAFTFYVIMRGQMKTLVEKRKLNRGLAAALILFETLFIFLIPLTGLGFLVADTISGIEIDPNALKDTMYKFVDKIESHFNIQLFTAENLSFIPKLGGNLVQTIAANSYSFVINSIVILFVLYFMLYSYKDFETTIWEVLPFTKPNKQIFVRETKLIIQANALGIPLLAVIQGVFAYVGYLIFGTPTPVLYAVLTAFATVIPLLGTTIIYLPLAIALLIQHDYANGIGLILYGIIVIGSVDNVARLMLQKKLADIHPLITVFGVIIGIPMFGFWGVIFGPLILSLFILFFNMYRHDYIEGSVALPMVTAKFVNKKEKKTERSFNIPIFKTKTNEDKTSETLTTDIKKENAEKNK